MSGIAGIIGKKNVKEKYEKKFLKMIKTLTHRGPDETWVFLKEKCLLGHTYLNTNNEEAFREYKNLVIIYDGVLYNSKTNTDTETILKLYARYKEKALQKLNGLFAFAIWDGKRLLLARDRVGAKPLFYTIKNKNLIFASELKAILAHPEIKPIITKHSLQELLALGPSRTPGCGIFKGIKELKPGHYLIYENGKITIKKYWKLKSKKHTESLEKTKKKIENIVTTAITSQIPLNTEICCLLSGGLDSSIITGIVAKEYKKQGKRLSTFSIDYKDNKKYFKTNKYQVSEDTYFIELMKNKYNTNHNYFFISEKELAKHLEDALIARDLPGMADIDSSLLWLSKKIKETHNILLSGEGADEIFGGYPWFYREELLNINGFPWIRHLEEREKLLTKKMRRKLKIKKYIKKCYKKAIKKTPFLKGENRYEKKMRKLFYINMTHFMSTLLERKDRMTMKAGIEVRIPFLDYKLIDYLWNVPFHYKYYNNIEKALLRDAMKEYLPEEIFTRKKNPYPKTYSPKYTNIVCKLLFERIKNNNTSLFKIFDKKALLKLIYTKGKYIKYPFFGQLMMGPQLIAYLYQFDLWLEKYNIILKI